MPKGQCLWRNVTSFYFSCPKLKPNYATTKKTTSSMAQEGGFEVIKRR